MNFFVYILYNSSCDKFYTGQTAYLIKRIKEHNAKEHGYTAKYQGYWQCIYQEKFYKRVEAIARERFLKKQKSKIFYRKLSGLT